MRAFPHGGGAAEGTAGAPCEHRVPRPGLDAELRARKSQTPAAGVSAAGRVGAATGPHPVCPGER